ncbi:50S ribosomal protein L25, partial [Dissostichus eleginoides]
SYDRLLQLTSVTANGVCYRFTVEEVVCPPKLRSSLFTTAAVDNIDHNPSSATARDSFHCTGISLVQHPTSESPGHDRGVLILNQSAPTMKTVAPLPPAYTN